MAISILLADDHTLFRRGLRRILEDEAGFSIVAEASSGIDAVELARQHRPDVAIIDIAMPELNGLEATAQILRSSPNTAVLILSMYPDERYVMRAVRVGARGYVLKDTVEQGLIDAIRRLHQGQAFFSPAIAKIFHQRSSDPFAPDVDERYDCLTDREKQIHHLLAEGKSNKEISARLGLSIHTAETHRARIMEKLGVHGIAELVLNAVRRGLIR